MINYRRDDVIQWIILNQFGRRNLPMYERARLALRLKPVFAEKARERMLSGKANPNQKSDEGMTSKQIAKVAGVSHDTIHKVEKIEAQATPEEIAPMYADVKTQGREWSGTGLYMYKRFLQKGGIDFL